MKKMKLSLIAAALFCLGACNKIDTALVEQVQAGLNKAQENRAAFETDSKRCVDLYEKLNIAPAGLKNNPKFGFVPLYSEVVMLNQAYANMITAQDEMIARQQSMLDDYTDGKVKKDSILEETQIILKNFDGYQGRVDMMSKRVDGASEKYTSIMADWNAAPEAEKAASAAMSAPSGLPDAATSRSTSPMPSSAPPADQTKPGALAPASGNAISTPQQPAKSGGSAIKQQ